jgi:hypothetical protein
MVAKPNFEVKFLLEPEQVMESCGDLNDQVMRWFELANRVTRISMQFLDSKAHVLHTAGWNVRIRKFEREHEFELTYKRRYPFGGGTLVNTLAAAEQDGFDSNESDYDAQVEWGAQGQTLTMSRRKATPERQYEALDLPDAVDARVMSTNFLPGKLARLRADGWAKQVLESAHVHGPVQGKRWVGSWGGNELCVELWKLERAKDARDRRIIEISFKHDDERQACAGREALRALLGTQGWLLERDVLKTPLILKSYC